MKAISTRVESAQTTVHPRLRELLLRHFKSEWRQPLHRPTVQAFKQLGLLLGENPVPLILDSGCGTGASTLVLAERYPDHCVIGVDQSAARLQRLAPDGLAQHHNAILLRAELESFWRLFVAAGWRAQRHYLLYPNPWPKAAQVARRWHGHPVFPTMLATASSFELRSNWSVYAEEYAFALRHAGVADTQAIEFECDEPLTPFERKYRDSGHVLWRVRARLR